MIRVLLADDDREKTSRIVSVLESAGIPRAQIDVVQTSNHAREKLTTFQYDLLILDVALPKRAEDRPDRQGGIELLEEILDRDVFLRPQHVLGLTAYEDLKGAFDRRFSAQNWLLDRYGPADVGWAERLKAHTQYILKADAQSAPLAAGSDIAIVTALDHPELTAVRKLNWNWKTPEMVGGVTYAYSGELESKGKSLSVVAAAAPSMGMVSAALLTARIIEAFRPRMLIMAGICAGVPDDCAIGDVLLADPTWDWQMGKYFQAKFQQAPEQIDVPVEVAQSFVQLSHDRSRLFEIHDGFLGEKPRSPPALLSGPVASGSSVLADEKIFSEIKQQHRKLLGIDMELYGVYAASKHAATPRPITFGMKSVCDFGDGLKNNKYQPYAAYISANVIAAFCEKFGRDLTKLS